MAIPLFFSRQMTIWQRRILLLLLLALGLFLTFTIVHATPPIEGNTVEFVDTGQSLGSSQGKYVAFGDLDGDGDVDAFVCNGESSPDKVWMNNGSGSFSDSGQNLGNYSCSWVALGDVDGDGDLDAVIANSDDPNGVHPDTLWLNNGSGIFSISTQNFGTWNSEAVSLGDLDRDGDLDIFFVTDGYEIWLNNGSGVFTHTSQNLPLDADEGVDLGDVDGDGDLDAYVVGGGTGNAVYNKLWLNNGSAFFTDSGQDLGQRKSSSVALGDLDGDGDLDAFVTNTLDGDRVWMNNGAGSFTDSGQSLAKDLSWDVKLGDLDGDGDLDAYVGTSTATDRVWVNDGQGGFVDSGLSLDDRYTYGIALGDIDGDGDLDAFSANGGPNNGNTVWRNDILHRNAPFMDSGQTLNSSNGNGVAYGDLDGDGDMDAFVAINGSNKVFLNDGSGAFTDSGQSLGNADSGGVALGDVDGDGDMDAFVANGNDTAGQANKVWLNNGSGVFSDSGQSLGSGDSTNVTLADLDNDGDLDAYVTNGGSSTGGTQDVVWTNDGSGNFSWHWQTPSSPADASSAVGLGDLDSDGDLDAFVATNGQQRVWLNNGNATFSSGPILTQDMTCMDIGLGDLDSDGDIDAFEGCGTSNVVWFNGGSANFTIHQQPGDDDNYGVALGDVDMDGDLDAFVARNSSGNQVLLNDGSGSFSDSGQSLGTAYSRDVALGDIDQDGDLDAYVANYNGSDAVWRNYGGSAGLDVTDTSPATRITPGNEDDVFKIVVSHNGIAVDRHLEVAKWYMQMYSNGSCTAPMDSSTANSLLDKMRVRLDDGDGVFETDGSDVVVAEVDTFSLSGGLQTILFTNDDTNVQMNPSTSKTYWVSLLANSPQGDICLQFDPDANAVMEGKTPDFSVSISDTTPTNTGSTPTAVRLRGVAATMSSRWGTIFVGLMFVFLALLLALLYRRKRKVI